MDVSADRMATTLMAIAAHPGDALFTMGAAVAQHIHDGGKGVFVSLTLGERGAPRGMPTDRYGEMQRIASEKAAKMLGAELELLTYPDGEIPLRDQTALAVCDIIRGHKADAVITHWSGSWHKDHQNCHLVARDAIFYASLATMQRKDAPHLVKRVFYADNWEDADSFKPDTYLDISDACDNWLRACDEFPMWRGQTGFFRYNDYYSSLAIMRGCVAGFKRAAALMSDPNERIAKVRSLV